MGDETAGSVMRALMITESLKDGVLPSGVSAFRERRYPHQLEGAPIEIIELEVPCGGRERDCGGSA